jgi:hypothetical protein
MGQGGEQRGGRGGKTLKDDGELETLKDGGELKTLFDAGLNQCFQETR